MGNTLASPLLTGSSKGFEASQESKVKVSDLAIFQLLKAFKL